MADTFPEAAQLAAKLSNSAKSARSNVVRAMIAADPDDEASTDEQLAQARPFAEVFPELAETLRRSAKP